MVFIEVNYLTVTCDCSGLVLFVVVLVDARFCLFVCVLRGCGGICLFVCCGGGRGFGWFIGWLVGWGFFCLVAFFAGGGGGGGVTQLIAPHSYVLPGSGLGKKNWGGGGGGGELVSKH